MRTNEVNIRDPYVLVHEGKYYLYGTRSATCWGQADGETAVLFSAGEAKWAKPVPFAKAEFGMDEDVYFTDGPGIVDIGDGKLYLTWSSWGNCGYAVGVAVSENGNVKGPWKQTGTPIYPANGGHGMMFRDLQGNLKFSLHFPNDKYKERPIFVDAIAGAEGLTLDIKQKRMR